MEPETLPLPTYNQLTCLQVTEGSQIGQYKILKKLGAGGMGIVFKAQDTNVQRLIAIKFMIKAGEGHAVQRFLRELEISAQLNHPNIVKIYHMGEYNKFPYFVMEFIEGKLLLDYIAEQKPSLPEKLVLVEKIAYALDYAHKNNVIHRDVKPANILVRTDGEPILMDFGVAKVTQVDRSLTRTGEIVGTLEYMAPEQAQGRKRAIDAQSDVYSLGAVFYEILTGDAPIKGETLVEKVYQIVYEKPPAPQTINSDIPTPVSKICLKAIEKQKENRYPSAKAMAQDIRAYLKGEITASVQFYRRQKMIRSLQMAAIALLVLISGIGLWRYWRLRATQEPPLTAAKSDPALQAQLRQEQAQLRQEEIIKYYKLAQDHLAQSPQQSLVYLNYVRERLAPGGQGNWPEVEKIAGQLPLLRLQAAFYAKEYEMVYNQGLPLTTGMLGKTNLWLMAQATFYCNRQEEASGYFQKLLDLCGYLEERKMQHWSPTDWEYGMGSLYYQGVIAFEKKDIAKAGELWPKYSRLVDQYQGPPFTFQALGELYHCATLLADLDRMPNHEETAAIGVHWQRVEAARQTQPELQDTDSPLYTLYRETHARYLCKQNRLVELATDPKIKQERDQRARQTIELVNACLDKSPFSGELYYLRCWAHYFLREYPEASTDADLACFWAPQMIGPFGLKVHLLFMSLQPVRLQGAVSHITSYFYESLRSQQDLFVQEFWQLKQKHQFRSYGITYDARLLEEYCEKLKSETVEAREAAKLALCTMIPYDKTQKSIRQKTLNFPAMAQALREVDVALTQKLAQEEQRLFCMHLAQEPWRGKVMHAERFYPHGVELLKETLAHHADLFLRFLAAKVLVSLPDLKIRKELEEKYLKSSWDIWKNESQRQHLLGKILVAAAWTDSGSLVPILPKNAYSCLLGLVQQGSLRLLAANAQDESSRQEKVQEAARANDFLQCCIVRLLHRQEANLGPIWETLFSDGSERVQAFIASSIPSPADFAAKYPELFRKLIAYLNQSIRNSSVAMQAYSINAVSDYLNFSDTTIRNQWSDIVKTQFALEELISILSRLLPQADPEVQKAIFHFWRQIATVVYWNNQKHLLDPICETLRPFWENSDPQIRYNAILTSAGLWDIPIFKQICFSRKAQPVERFAALLGALRFKSEGYAKERQIHFYQQLLLATKTLDDEDWRVKSSLLYLMGREGKEFVKLLEKKYIDAMKVADTQDGAKELRGTSIIGVGYWPMLPATVWPVLYKILQEDKSLLVRAATMGVLLHHTFGKQTEQWQKLHAAAKQESPDFRLSAAWGYSLPWEGWLLPSADHIRQSKWDPGALWSYACLGFLVYAQENGLQDEPLNRLHNILDLLADMPDHPFYQDNLYLLAMLYEQKHEVEKILPRLVATMELLGNKDTRFLLLWSRLMLTLDPQEVIARLEPKLAQHLNHPAATDDDVVSLQQRGTHESHLKRCLAAAYLQTGQKLPLVPGYLNDQYLLLPEDPLAAIPLARYYMAEQQWDKALLLLDDFLARLPKVDMIALEIARWYVLQRRPGKAKDYVLHARIHSNRLSWQYVAENYPELRSLPEARTIFLPLPK